LLFYAEELMNATPWQTAFSPHFGCCGLSLLSHPYRYSAVPRSLSHHEYPLITHTSAAHEKMAAASATGGAKLASLPIINIAPWLGNHDGHGRLSTSAALHAACLEYGFFYLDVSEFIDPSEPEELTQLARDFFALPQEEKNKIGLSKQDGARGSVRMFSSFISCSADRSYTTKATNA
jgi:hypothetical protein